MNIAKLDTLDIAYLDEGEGEPVVLIHGFASNAATNWVGPGWVQTLVDSGYRVVAFDNRGHGQSTKFYDDSAYSLEQMSDDVIALLDHLEISRCHVMGYSLGARISSILASRAGHRFNKVVLAGNGYNMIEGGFDSRDIHEGLAAESDEEVTSKVGAEFRKFAKQTGSDLKALAACIMGGRTLIPRSVFEEISLPVLVTIGTEDTVATGGERPAEIIENAQYRPIPKRNHMNAVGDRIYKQNVLEFLA